MDLEEGSRVRPDTGQTYKVLVVDDSPTVQLQLRAQLATESLDVRAVDTGKAAIAVALSWRPECVLLDYFLPDITGEEVVEKIRCFDADVQIVLITGQAARKPARLMMKRLDIQGYHDKTNGLETVMIWVDAALKGHAQKMVILRQTRCLEVALEVSREIHQLLPVPELFGLGLRGMQRILSAWTPGLGTDGALIWADEGGTLSLRRAIGKFAGCARVVDLPDHLRVVADTSVDSSEVVRSETAIAIPLMAVHRPQGVFAFELDPSANPPTDHLLLFSQQVSTAIENNLLFEMATIDTLTGLVSRAHLMRRTVEWLKISTRKNEPFSLIFLDVDRLKPINDRFGHAAGDVALATIGATLIDCIRDVDIAGRYGGDEFVVLLPSATPTVAGTVAGRICRALRDRTIHIDDEAVSLTASIGFGGLCEIPLRKWMRSNPKEDEWNRLAAFLIGLVDDATYIAKQAGGNQVAGLPKDLDVGKELLEFLHWSDGEHSGRFAVVQRITSSDAET